MPLPPDPAPGPAKPPKPVAPAPQPPMRRFGDYDATRQAVFSNALEAARNIQPVENSRYSLSVHDVGFQGPDRVTYADHKRALYEGRTLGRRLTGTLRLTDKASGAVADARRLTLASVPVLTQQGVFVLDGNASPISHQMRLAPGAYVRRKSNGELESHLPFLPGEGVPHRFFLDPASGQIKTHVGQAELPAYTLMKALGATDEEIADAWGPGVAAANAKIDKPHHLEKYWDRMGPGGKNRPDDLAAGLRQHLETFKFDPWVTARTLGAPLDRYGKEAALRATGKLIKVFKGQAQPDDRDNPAYAVVWGPEHLIAERIARSRPLLTKALWQATNKGSLKGVQPGMLTAGIRALFSKSGLGQSIEGTNSAEFVDHGARITKIGEGGIGRSADAVPASSRDVNPGQFLFIDPIRASESENVGVDLRVAFGTRLGADRQLYAPLLDPKTNRIVYRSPRDLADATVAFPGWKTATTPLVPAVSKGRMTWVRRDQIDYAAPSMEQSFSPLTNLVPLKSASKPHRASMGGRYIVQALPLATPEAPLVRTQVPNQPGKSFEELFGRHMGAVLADKPGVVTEVTPDGVKVRHPDGTETGHELYNWLPSGRKTGNHNYPLVQVGQQVQPGGVLARSEFTDEHGHAAYGANLRTAFASMGGKVYEDSILASQSAAQRLSSSHLYRHHLPLDEHTKTDVAAYLSAFPGKHPLASFKNFDPDGVIKPGTRVESGQPLILGVRKKQGEFGRLSRSGKAGLTDASQVWEHDEPGVVTDVARTPEGLSVSVHTVKPLKDGDKLCYDPETEVLTSTGWKRVGDITVADQVATLNPETDTFEYLHPVAAVQYHHKGRMYRVKSTQVDLLVTDNHKLYVDLRWASGYRGQYTLTEAKDLYGKRYRLKRNADWVGVSPSTVTLPGVSVAAGRGGRGTRLLPDVTVPAKTYAMVLGMFLSEGNLVAIAGSGTYGFEVSQIKEPNRQVMIDVLAAAGIKFFSVSAGTKVRICSRVWYEHLKQFGKSADKFIPDVCFSWGRDLQAELYRWLCWGDGHAKNGRQIHYCSTSPRLADGLQRLALHLGISANIQAQPARMGFIKGKEYSHRAVYRVYFYTNKNSPEINHSHAARQSAQEERWVDYDGPVHCVTMPKWHVVYVRRGENRKPVWSGNSGRHGNKGVVVILPDHKMPTDAQGRPVDVVLSSLGTISRANPSAIFEAHLGKIAAKTGKPYVVDDFHDNQHVADFVDQEAKKHDVPFMETLTDPETGRAIPNVGVGNLYLMKLLHIAESKSKGRGLGGYDEGGQPLRGQSGKAMRASLGDTHALLSHGACFVGATKILTERGELPISNVVGKRLRINVACASPDGVVTYRPVTNWFVRSVDSQDLVEVQTTALTGKKHENGRHRRFAIRCTKDHQFYTPAGKVRAVDLTAGTTLYTRGTALEPWQAQLLIGGLMGDSYGPKTFDSTSMRVADPDAVKPKALARGGIRIAHGAAQQPYLRWKAAKMSNLWSGAVGTYYGGYANTQKFRVAFRKHPDTSQLIEEFYRDGTKRPPLGVVAAMGWYGIGIWFGDDGGCVCPGDTGVPTAYRFSTNGFLWADGERLCAELTAFTGLPWGLVKDARGRPVMNLAKGGRTGDQLDEWAAKLAPYLPPMMGYKIRDRFAVGGAWELLAPPTGERLETCEVVAVVPARLGAHERNLVYDITVDGHHNYFAGGVLVSNSAVLRDLHMYKGQANDVFWQAYMSGFPPPRPGSSKAFDRFLTELRASGVHPVRENDRIHLTALRDADVHELAGDREVKNSETLDFNRNGAPVAGGLFDEALTGGPEGTAWSKISLHEPVPNPVAEDPVRRLLGLTQAKFRDVMAGRAKLNDQTGPTALLSALKSFDVEAELRRTEEAARSGRKTARDDANRKLGYLRHMAATGRTPADWFLSAIPVLPPMFRPIRTSSFGGRDNVIISDPNLLYKDVMEANKALKMLSGQVGDVGDERLALYDSVKAVMGLGEPVSAKNKERGVKGVLEKLLGTSAKHGYLQQKLLGTPADLSGRGQILPDPDLDMDQIGIPESVAWEVYHPFIVRRMVQSGMSRADAARVVEARADVARKAMVDEMEARPIQATRYPALHRYSVMAFRPRLTAGDAIRITPIVTKGYGADFNGDSCHTPLLTVLIGGKLFLGSFEQFIARYVSPDYQERDVLTKFGKQTTVFGFAPEADVRVPSVDAAGVFGWRPAAEISIHTSHGPKCYQVQTETGLDAVFTAHHNFVRLDETCRLVATKTETVTPGSLVPHLVGVDPFAACAAVPHGRPDLPLTFDTGLWLGHYLGDGSVTGREDTVSHASTDAATLALLERSGVHFSDKKPWREGNGFSTRWSDRNLVRLLDDWVGRGAAGKRVAGWMAAAPIEFRKGLITGYLLAEGNVCRHNDGPGGTDRWSAVRVECVSRELLLDFKLILASMGVVGRIRAGKAAQGNCRSTWVLTFGAQGLRRLDLSFPATAKGAQFRALRAPTRARDGHWDVVPFPVSVVALVRARGACLKGGGGKALRQTLGRRPKPMPSKDLLGYAARGSISRHYANKVIDSLALRKMPDETLKNWISIVENQNMVWDTITAVNPVDRPDVTYDFHVPGAETFCVDGFFLTHNTMTLHVPLTDDAVKEAYEKMLPSKNLYSTSDFKPKNYLPNMEFVQGLHYASTADAGNAPVQFRTRAEALKALRSGQIGLDTRVHIAED